jgi:hypothetical protein
MPPGKDLPEDTESRAPTRGYRLPAGVVRAGRRPGPPPEDKTVRVKTAAAQPAPRRAQLPFLAVAFDGRTVCPSYSNI